MAKTSDSLLWPALAVIGATIFGDSAHKVAELFVCTFSKTSGCSGTGIVDALNVGTLLSASVAITVAGWAVRKGEVSARNATLTIVGAMAGALIALLTASAKGNNGAANFELLAQPMYFYGLSILLFMAPLLIPRPENDWRPVVAGQLQAGVALLYGLLIGGMVQIFAEVIWRGWDVDTWGSSKFVVAPSGTVIGAGVWSVALLDPYLRPEVWDGHSRRRVLWLLLLGAGGVAVAAGFGALFGKPAAGSEVVGRAITYSGLLLPGLFAAWIGAFLSPPSHRGIAIILAGFAGALVAGMVAATRVHLMVPEDWYPFSLAHALASFAVVLVPLLTQSTLLNSSRP
jgi:hypothetical protein